MQLYHDLELWADEGKDLIHGIIEIPMGSMVKYEFNKELNTVEVDRFFSAPMGMPVNYGFLSQSHNADDGDPLDIIVLSSYAIQAGAVVKAKVIGVMDMLDTGELDYKIIAVAHKDPTYGHVDHIDKLNEHYKKQIQYFFEHYKKLEGKEVKISGFFGREKALEIIAESVKEYKIKYNK